VVTSRKTVWTTKWHLFVCFYVSCKPTRRLKTGCNYISRTANRRPVPTAIYPGFRGRPTRRTHHWHPPTSTDTGNRKRKMATTKPEVVKSLVVQQIDMQFQWLYPGFRVTYSMGSSLKPGNVDRHPKRKMATAKPEVVISHVVQQTDMRFQRLDSGFRDHLTQWSHRRHPSTSIDTWNARWRPPNRKYLYLTSYSR
jgi:hypothetical protein